jgi:hypothetical protein
MFVPLLSDREMEVFTVPSKVHSYVFYPFRNDELLTENVLRADFSKTWAFLELHRATLEQRSGVRSGTLMWWKPERPRDPKNMFRPKIVTPHVVITPKFGLDLPGQYAVSRSPLIFSKFSKVSDKEHLLYLLGVLNSTACFWHIAQRAHIYQHGYSRLEMARLRGTRIPSFQSVDKGAARRLIRVVEARLHSQGKAAFELEDDLYNLDANERAMMASGAQA